MGCFGAAEPRFREIELLLYLLLIELQLLLLIELLLPPPPTLLPPQLSLPPLNVREVPTVLLQQRWRLSLLPQQQPSPPLLVLAGSWGARLPTLYGTACRLRMA